MLEMLNKSGNLPSKKKAANQFYAQLFKLFSFLPSSLCWRKSPETAVGKKERFPNPIPALRCWDCWLCCFVFLEKRVYYLWHYIDLKGYLSILMLYRWLFLNWVYELIYGSHYHIEMKIAYTKALKTVVISINVHIVFFKMLLYICVLKCPDHVKLLVQVHWLRSM